MSTACDARTANVPYFVHMTIQRSSSCSSAFIAKSLGSVTPMAAAEVETELEGGAKSQLQDLAFNAAGYHATRIRKNFRDHTLEITCRYTSVICIFVDLCVRAASLYLFVCPMGTGCAHSGTSESRSKRTSTM